MSFETDKGILFAVDTDVKRSAARRAVLDLFVFLICMRIF
jgi:hypothetical protein